MHYARHANGELLFVIGNRGLRCEEYTDQNHAFNLLFQTLLFKVLGGDSQMVGEVPILVKLRVGGPSEIVWEIPEFVAFINFDTCEYLELCTLRVSENADVAALVIV